MCPICHGAVRDADCIATEDRAEWNVCPLKEPCTHPQPQAWPMGRDEDDEGGLPVTPRPLQAA